MSGAIHGLKGYNARDLRKTNMDGWFEFIRVSCPICHKTGMCCIHSDGDKVGCSRVPSDRILFRNSNTYLHRLNGEIKPIENLQPQNRIPRSELADSHHRHIVYTIVLSFYELSRKHYHDLINERNLSPAEIKARGYGSYTKERKQGQINDETKTLVSVWEELFKHNGLPEDAWKGVPGFSQARTELGNKTITFPIFETEEGLLAPFRNELNEIIGLQIRPDSRKIRVKDKEGDLNFNVIPKYQLIEGKRKPIFLLTELDGNEEIFYPIDEFKQWIDVEFFGRKSRLKFDQDPKYKWVSSSNKYLGTAAESGIHFSFDFEAIKDFKANVNSSRPFPYAETIKSAFLTEGSIKADVISHHLRKAYSEEELSSIGQMVVAVAGTNNWQAAVSKLLKTNIRTITIAYDMDVLTNKNVELQYSSLVKTLKQKGFKVNLAIWSLSQAKGLDDLLNLNYKPKIIEA